MENADLKYTTELKLSSPYVCKWDVTVYGMNMNQGVLILPPCTYITPHWHPDTYELNFILEGNLTYWIYNYTNADLKYTSKMTLSSPYVCKWDVTIPGMNMNQGVLVLPP